ncbi:MAG: nicotinate-nucleotide--dimethylbenzimidazole phosphoribosyltransferase [Actinomycetota bacterium]
MVDPTTEALRAELATMPSPSPESADMTADRAANTLRPGGALAQLDELAVWVASWHGDGLPRIERPHCLVFAGDHGVAAEGVSAYPAEVTAAMLTAVETKQASINALAAAARADLTVHDVGVGIPTGNLRVEPAMSRERFADAFEAGRAAVREIDTDLLVLGELGIANTTAAAAVTAAIIGPDAQTFVGRGTGVDDDGLALKQAVVADAVARVATTVDPIELLRELGGTELVAMAGAMVEARARRIPILLDGYIATAPAVALHAVDPDLVSHLRAGHRSAEPGHRLALERLGLEPLLTMEFRLGEGSGAMVALPIVIAACRAVTDVATFEEFFGAAAAGSEDDAAAP